MTARYGYKIAQGWDNTSGLANFESISVSSGEDLHTLIPMLAAGTYFLPETFLPFASNVEITASGALTQRGYATVVLNFKVIGAKSYAYLESTYGAGNATYRGKVTLTVRSEDFTTYDDYNAILKLANAPKPIYRMGKFWYENVQATFLIRGAA